MDIQNYKNKNVLVVGLGSSGFAAASLLADRGFSVKVSDNGISDEPRKKAGTLRERYNIEIETGGHSKDFFKNSALVVMSPGVDVKNLYDTGILSRQSHVISELELGYHFCPAPIIAITGTNGKTTVTELTGAILERNGMDEVVCGNIGNPLCGEISRIGKQSIVVAEVSSFQLQYIRDFRPFIGILLNVSEDHYERHGGFLPYKEAKFNIFKNQTEKDRALLFSDLKADPLRDGIKSRIDFFGEAGTAGSVYPGKIIVNMGDGKPLLIETENICLEGTHNMFNASASICASKILGVPDRIIRQVISSYKASAHRFQKLGVYNDVLYIDDSKATNIDATRVALQSVKGDVLLIAGGKDKGGDYSVMRKLIKDKVKTLILLGEAAGRIRGAFSGYTRIIDADSLKEAVIAAADMATRGDTVMLSPMCSSFDMFSSYKHRGEAYQAAVKEAIARVKVSD